jgi:predicted kinase
MRKWMRERLKRRKQTDKGTVEEKAPSPQPLQPKYFENESSEPEPRAAAPEPEPQHEPAPESVAKTPQGRQRPTRRRRGRGGRGRAPKRQPISSSPPAGAQQVVPEPVLPSEPVSTPEPEAIAATPEPAAAPLEPAPARASKGTVVLAIGLPGSGKSSWFKRHNIRPLSSDLLRQLLFDDAEEQRFQDLVFANLRSMLKARLIARRPMNYVDATNLTPHDRRNWIKLAKDFGYDVQGVFFDVPVEVCLERNRKRSRTVGEDVMRRMAGKLRPPTFDEGFSKITVVRVKKQEQQPEAP